MPDYKLVVVGDKKTPVDWRYDNVEFLSTSAHENIGEHLHNVLPFNHYSRKMMGYIHAIAKGAELIIDTDDDNIPKEDWSFPSFEDTFSYIPATKGL